MVAYDDEGSSDSEHDAYRARMIAEGEEKDSEDGKTHLIPKPDSLLGSNPYMHSSHIIRSKHCTYMVGFLPAEDSDFVAGDSGSEDDLE